jgi:hypothetical protein
MLTHDQLSQALLEAVRSQRFDALCQPFPSIDLAVVAWPRDAVPIWANVLFSRDFPQGIVVQMDERAGEVSNVRYLADQTDAHGESHVWRAQTDWDRVDWKHLAGGGLHRFVAPYPASLIKLMVAVGVARLVDADRYRWDALWPYGDKTRTVAQWTESMLVASSNEATNAMVALLHAGGLIEHSGAQEVNSLEQMFAIYGLHSLRLSDTRADGGWRNADGAGVGHLQMTAWDTARLLWLMVCAARPETTGTPWLLQGAPPLLSKPQANRLWAMLADQGLHGVLSSTALAGVPGCQQGIAAHMPERWLQKDGSALVQDYAYPPDIRPANAQAQVHFAHKTGTTDNYCSDAGWVTPLATEGRNSAGHYVIAMTSNLGARFAPAPACSTDWRIPRMAAAIDAWLRPRLA